MEKREGGLIKNYREKDYKKLWSHNIKPGDVADINPEIAEKTIATRNLRLFFEDYKDIKSLPEKISKPLLEIESLDMQRKEIVHQMDEALDKEFSNYDELHQKEIGLDGKIRNLEIMMMAETKHNAELMKKYNEYLYRMSARKNIIKNIVEES